MNRGGHRIKASFVKAQSPADQLKKTVALIGHGIRNGSHYPQIRLLAAQVAARAPGRKNYRAQLHALFSDFLRRWRYVKDPTGLETVVTSGRAIHDLVLGGADPRGRGHGDCDDATVALGALARAVGIEPRIVVMAARLKPGQRGPARASHVYPEFHIPGEGWITADPVAWPRCQFGTAPPAAWRRRYTLDAQPIGPRTLGEESEPMQGLSGLEGWPGVGLEDYGLAGVDGEEPADWAHVVQGFGAYADTMGIMGGGGILCEVEPATADGLARTPMLEISPESFQYMQNHGAPYVGMCALGDDGSVYQYQDAPGVGGFFKKLFRAGRKLFKRVGKFARKLIKKLPFGKYLIKLHDKLHKVAMKLLRPLNKLIGKAAKFLAPIAAMIPGYGPAISVALKATGKISSLIQKFDVKQDKTGKMKFKSPRHHKAFSAALKKAAALARAQKHHLKLKHPGLIQKGTPEHAAKMRQAGAQPENEPQEQTAGWW